MANTPMIREALEAAKFLGIAATCDKCDPETAHRVGLALDVVGSALEAAEAEAECWRVIEAWLMRERKQERGVGFEFNGILWEIFVSRVLPFDGDGTSRVVHAPTRLEVLQKAAEFCRKELT